MLGRVTQNRCVDVPAGISKALGRRRIPVRADVLGTPFESTLVPRREGLHRLFIPSLVWRAHGLDLGDTLPVVLRVAAPAPPHAPKELVEAAGGDPVVLGEYARITPADRRQITRRLDAARSPEARRRLLEHVAALLRKHAASRRT